MHKNGLIAEQRIQLTRIGKDLFLHYSKSVNPFEHSVLISYTDATKTLLDWGYEVDEILNLLGSK